MPNIQVDLSQLAKLAADLRAHSRATPSKAAAVVGKGALNVKNDWRKTWAGLRHAPYVGAAVTYDTKVSRTGVAAEIGPDKGRRQGALGNVIEFGTAKNGPRPGGAPALAAEEPRFVEAAQKLVDGLL